MNGSKGRERIQESGQRIRRGKERSRRRMTSSSRGRNNGRGGRKTRGGEAEASVVVLDLLSRKQQHGLPCLYNRQLLPWRRDEQRKGNMRTFDRLIPPAELPSSLQQPLRQRRPVRLLLRCGWVQRPQRQVWWLTDGTGYYNFDSSTGCSKCPPGSYCLGGSSKADCPAHSYR